MLRAAERDLLTLRGGVFEGFAIEQVLFGLVETRTSGEPREAPNSIC